ncbi:hypothetical protein [Yoonia sp. SS1-5]|uniref:Alpha/beta hydrolase n=1 Tax=Yoonia rhodophyticola TaxID=3137370 RepID=A0AAN0M8B8_9RHOB
MSREMIGVLVIHGVGGQGAMPPQATDKLTFSRNMSRRVRQKIGADATRISWREVFWSDILQCRQQAYMDSIREKTSADAARAFMMAALSDAAAYRKTADGSAAIYEQIHARVEMAVRDLERDIGPDGQILILAHSLGGHIISNHIYDLQRFAGRSGRGRFGSPLQNMRTVAGLMTFGCNIPIFLFGHRAEDVRPIGYPGEDLPEERQIVTWWQNFYDKQDILAYPIGPVAPSYAKMVSDRHLRDVPINLGVPAKSGWDPLSHGRYWEDAELIAPVVHYLSKMMV